MVGAAGVAWVLRAQWEGEGELLLAALLPSPRQRQWRRLPRGVQEASGRGLMLSLRRRQLALARPRLLFPRPVVPRRDRKVVGRARLMAGRKRGELST